MIYIYHVLVLVSGSKAEAFWNLILDPIKKLLISEMFQAVYNQNVSWLIPLGSNTNQNPITFTYTVVSSA